MDAVLLAARITFAAVFLISGLAKALDRSGTIQSLIDFGVPNRIARAIATGLPLVELAVAVLLIPTATAWASSIAGMALLTVFTGAIAFALATGRRPDCHCFGQLYSSRIGWSTILRNLFLAGLLSPMLIFGLSDPGYSAVNWMHDLSLVEQIGMAISIAMFVILAAQGWFSFQLLKQNGRILVRLDALEASVQHNPGQFLGAPAQMAPAGGLAVGSMAPGFSLQGLFGETVTLQSLLSRRKPTVIIFSDPKCGPCNSLMPTVADWQSDPAGKMNIVVVSRESIEINRAKREEYGLESVLLQNDREVAEAYQSYGTPSAVAISPDGTIQSPLAQGAEAIRQLISSLASGSNGGLGESVPVIPSPLPSSNGHDHHTHEQAHVTLGAKAPQVRLADLSGQMVDLANFSRSRIALLFWNPGCGFCQQMLADLKEWESTRTKQMPKLMLVSTGDVETNRSMGLRSPVLLDDAFDTGRKFGASGTPSAVLIDAKGKIASEVVVGASNVMGLLSGKIPAAKSNGNGRAQPTPLLSIGMPAPEIRLPDLENQIRSTKNHLGRKALILFWNPSCGYCQSILPSIQTWEKNTKGNGWLDLVLVSTGGSQANRAMALSSTVLIEPSFQTGHKFGATGTPTAVLIDEDGNIASDLAVGGDAVLNLMGA
jgi:thiol-disulfide isomerase/thioredoxin